MALGSRRSDTSPGQLLRISERATRRLSESVLVASDSMIAAIPRARSSMQAGEPGPRRQAPKAGRSRPQALWGTLLMLSWYISIIRATPSFV
jgi:hypothetical protein